MEVKLPDICQIQYGFAFDSSKFSTTDGIPLVRIRDVVRGYSETRTAEKCSEEYFVDNGDLLVGMDGEFNIARWQGGRALLNQRVCRLIPNDSIDKGYLFYFMPQALKKIEDQTPFVTVKHLSAKQLNSIRVPLPTLDIQRHISRVLDKVNGLIFLRQQQLAKLDELVKARFVEMFGDVTSNPKSWNVEPLGKHVDVLTGFPFDSKGYAINGIKICGGLIIMPGQINWEDCKYWPDIGEYKNYLLADSDIVMALDRPWISSGFKIAMVSQRDLPCLLIQRTARVRSHDMNKNFVYSLLQDQAFQTHCNVTGSLVPHISHKDIVSYPVIVPPIDVQTNYSMFFSKVENQKLTIQQSLAKLEVLKKALMQEYFG